MQLIFLKDLICLIVKFAATPMNLNEKMQLNDGTKEANSSYLKHTQPVIAFSVKSNL